MTQLRQKYPFNYLFRSFSFQLQFSPVLCLFLTLKTHLFHLLTYEKEITKDFSVYCKRTKRQHNTRKKQRVSFIVSFFDFSFLNYTYESSSMKWEETLSVLFWFLLFFLIKPYFSSFWYCVLIQFMKIEEEKNSVMKNTKQKRYKILGKKRSERKPGLKPRHRHQKMRRNQLIQ